MIVASVLVLAGVAGYGFHEHQSLGKAHAHSATLSHQLGKTKKDLKSSEVTLQDTKNDLSNANIQLGNCASATDANRHIWKALGASIHAGSTDGFTKIGYLDTALTQLKLANKVIDGTSYTNIDDLNDACDNGSLSNS